MAAAQPTSQPASQPAGAGAVTGAPFSGLIKLGEGIGPEALKDTDTLFITARMRAPNGAPGQLVAAQRQGKVEFPFRYEIGPKDLMMPGLPFAGPFLVQARVDRDADPMTRGPDDLYAEFEGAVNPGQEGVHLVLSKTPNTPPPPPPAPPPPMPAPAP